MRQQFATVLVALMLVTAGCSVGNTGPGDSGEPSDGISGDATGTIDFYISDQPGAIEDFRHLNVTIDQVAFQKADGEETDDEADSEDGDDSGENATTTTSPTEVDDEAEGNESDMQDENDSGLQTFDVEGRTVDLTRLKGENATLLEEFEVENGTYTQVRISVSEINATLTDGSSADVKLPSEVLRINQEFVVGNNESVDFVYDINVVKRGNSGSYNIKPVAGQSGTDVPIRRVDEDDEMESKDGDDDDDSDEMDETPTTTADGGESMGSSGEQGQMNFYVSDQQNAIDDFRYLNVTIDEVSLRGPAANGSNTTYAVDNRTVDLTELKGDNATLLRTFDVPAGNYTKVFISISEVDGTLTDGSSTDVKLPSSKLQLNENFEVTADSEVDFVYDITVIKRGNSGSYNIKPVASESGTDVPIKRVDEGGEDDEGADRQRDRGDEMAGNETATFDAEFLGNVTAGENATVYVSQNGTAVENATVSYNGTDYATDAQGNVTFVVPSDAEEVEVEITYEGESLTLEATVDSGNEATTESGQESDGSEMGGSGSGSDDGSSDRSTETGTTTPTPTPTETAN
jgi:hypothetical protein